jgi:hypothetical protein
MATHVIFWSENLKDLGVDRKIMTMKLTRNTVAMLEWIHLAHDMSHCWIFVNTVILL